MCVCGSLGLGDCFVCDSGICPGIILQISKKKKKFRKVLVVCSSSCCSELFYLLVSQYIYWRGRKKGYSYKLD